MPDRTIKSRLGRAREAVVAIVVGAAFFTVAQPASAAAFQQFQLHTATPLVGNDFHYLVGDWNQSGKPDLVAIKYRNTGTGTNEVHVLSGESGFQQFVLQTGTPLSGDNFDYALTDWDGDRVPDLVAIMRLQTGSGKIEVHILSGKSRFQQFVLHTATPLVGDDFHYVVGDWNRLGKPDLLAIKYRNTGTGTNEVHVLSGESGFQQFVLQTGVPLSGDAFDYALTDWDFNHVPDLLAVQRLHTGTGTIEAHILAGPWFQSFVLHTGTPLVGDNFYYAVSDYNGDRRRRPVGDHVSQHGLREGRGARARGTVSHAARRAIGAERDRAHVLDDQAPMDDQRAGPPRDPASTGNPVRLERSMGNVSIHRCADDDHDRLRPRARTDLLLRVRAYNGVTGLNSYSSTVCGSTDPTPNLFIPQGAIWDTQLDDPFTSAPTLVHAGDAFSIAWDECNNGQAIASAHQSKLFLKSTGPDWTEVGTVSVPAIAPGGCAPRPFVRFPSGLSAGQYDAAVVVDSGGAVTEMSEVDNVGQMGFNILS